MRKMLVTAVALAPLCVATGAWADTQIADKRTTPVETATAGNVTITKQGSVEVTTANTPAVTINSNNTVTNQGSIKMENLTTDGQTGILIVGGHTGGLTNSGSISITDDLTPPDTDKDGDVDGPFAHGSGRYGVRLTGPGAFTGDINNDATSSIRVEGNNSYGVSIESALNGNLIQKGVISLVGDHGYGLRVTGAVSGNFSLGTTLGGVNASGDGTVGVSLEGDISGSATISGSVTTSGYRITSRPTQAVIDKLEPDDLLQSGSALVVGANLNKGLVIDARPNVCTTKNLDTDGNPGNGFEACDSDGDGVDDATQSTGSITTFGGAPAMKIGSDSRDVVLSVVDSTKADYNYGLIMKGSVFAAGVYDNVAATAVDITPGAGHTVDIAGGIRNSGSVGATAFSADATAIRVGSGTTTGTLRNDGAITASVTSEDVDTATAIDIRAGASIGGGTGTFTNSGAITSTVFGEKGAAVAVIDRAGTLGSILNTGSITAQIVATDSASDLDDPNTDPSDEVITGSKVAVDVSANNTGVLIWQQAPASTTAAAPSITGDIRFGGGADTLRIEKGSVTGDVSFGNGSDVLTVNGDGAAFNGKILDTDGDLAVNVTKGTLTLGNTSAVNVSTLSVGSTGKLIVTLDPTATSGSFNVSGAANLANGAGLGVRFVSLLPVAQGGSQTFNIIHAGALTTGTLDTSSLSGTPFLFSTTAQVVGGGGAAGDVNLLVTRKTAADLGMIRSESEAYDAVYDALGTDVGLRNALLAQTTKSGFYNIYQQLLPDHSAAPLLSLASGQDSVSRAMYDRRLDVEPGETTGWLQEINFYADKDKDQSYGFRSKGFGVAGGLERGSDVGALGVSLAFTSSDMKDPEAEGDENTAASNLELGVYWRQASQNWRMWARGAAGYAWFDSTRQVIDPSAGLNEKFKASWSGWSATLAGGASYEYSVGRIYYIRPEVSAEYFYLDEKAYSESGDPDLAYAIDSRTGHLFTTKAMVSFGGRFGTDGWLQPELRLGYRASLSSDPGVTVARFRNGGSPFTLTPDDIDGGGPVIGFRVLAGGAMGFVALEGDAELMDLYKRYTILLRAGFRF